MREGNQNTGDITQHSAGFIKVASGPTSARPTTPVPGMVRFNEDTGLFEFFQMGGWQNPVFVPRTRLWYADMFDAPVTADWAVNGLSPATTDPVNTAITVRAFDDTAEEGLGFSTAIPPGTTLMTLRLKGRAASTPTATANGVVMRLHRRAIPNNAAIGAWGSTTLSTITMPTNTFYQYASQTFTIASLGLTVGTMVQFQITRQGSAAADTLAGDFYLIEVGIEFT